MVRLEVAPFPLGLFLQAFVFGKTLRRNANYGFMEKEVLRRWPRTPSLTRPFYTLGWGNAKARLWKGVARGSQGASGVGAVRFDLWENSLRRRRRGMVQGSFDCIFVR